MVDQLATPVRLAEHFYGMRLQALDSYLAVVAGDEQNGLTRVTAADLLGQDQAVRAARHDHFKKYGIECIPTRLRLIEPLERVLRAMSD